MHTTYGMDTCIETNEILAFGMEVYSRYIPDICKNLEYVRHIPDICLTYDTIRIPDVNEKVWRNGCSVDPEHIAGASHCMNQQF